MHSYQAYFIDLDGTVYRGTQKIPAAARFIARLQEAQKKILFVTNNSTRTPEFVADNLSQHHDIHVGPDNIYTSALATADYLDSIADDKRKVYVIGESGLKKALSDKNFILTNADPDYVVVGLDTHVTYHDFEIAVLAIRAGAIFIGTNGDSNLPNERGMTPGAGSLVKLVEYATQTQPIMVGKPEKLIMNMAMKKVKLLPKDIIMVGDNYNTDILAGIHAHMDTLLVFTGLTQVEDLKDKSVQPTYTRKSLDDWVVD